MEPLPCPFCGSDDIQYNDGIMVQDYSCRVCGCIGPDGERSERSAIERWNTRLVAEPEE